MGTNYYLITDVCKYCRRRDKIHLGKFKYGFKFLLRYDSNRYANWQGMRFYLERMIRNGSWIEDEYGRDYPLEEFIDLVEKSTRTGKSNTIVDDKVLVDKDGYEFLDLDFC